MDKGLYQFIRDGKSFLELRQDYHCSFFTVIQHFSHPEDLKVHYYNWKEPQNTNWTYRDTESTAIAMSLQKAHDLFTSKPPNLSMEMLREIIHLEEPVPLPDHVKATPKMKEQIKEKLVNFDAKRFGNVKLIDLDDPYQDFEDFLEHWILDERHVALQKVIDAFNSGGVTLNYLPSDLDLMF